MKSAQDLLQENGSALLNRSSGQSQNRTGIEAAQWVWRKMTEMYGAQWTRERGAAPPSTWTLALGKHDPETIRKAMARVPGRYPDWPPTLPQFLACCAPQPEDYGAPSFEAAWHEARTHAMQAGSHAWSHDAVVFTGRKIGWGDIHRASGEFARELKRTFRAEYSRTVDALAQGQPLLEHDAARPPSHAAELKTEANAEKKALAYQGINGPQALRLMRSMMGGNHDD